MHSNPVSTVSLSFLIQRCHLHYSSKDAQSMSVQLNSFCSWIVLLLYFNVIRAFSMKKENHVTILGFGSLLSEKSARNTFPDLRSFRLGRVENYRRVFGHPASIFFERGIANVETKEMSSLCAEYCPGASIICSVFEVDNENGKFLEGDEAELIPSIAFREREEEFEIVPNVSFFDLASPNSDISSGILCTTSTDALYIERWGEERFKVKYEKYGIKTIWGWEKDSGLRPCGPYLRHCVLAATKLGKECLDSFLDDTVLVDRKTTVRDYLRQFPKVMDTLPPPDLQERYGG